MANTTSHDLTTFAFVKLFFFNSVDDAFDFIVYLTALWKCRIHVTLLRNLIIYVFELWLVVTLRNYLSLFDTQGFVGTLEDIFSV